MRDIILNQHHQITHSLEVNKNVRADANVDSIILAGLGGSGHPGDLLNALGLTTKPLYVHRNYELPTDYLNHMGLKNPLIIISSYSGNTEEAISSYQAAKKAGLPIMVSTSGGQLLSMAQKDDHPVATIDFPGMQPRHTLFAAFTGIYTVLKNNDLAENIDDDLLKTASFLEKETPALKQPARELAANIKNKIPVIISSDQLGFAAKNFKIQTNENAKYPAFWNTFPELNHNELVGFSKLKETQNPNNFFALFLRNENDHPRVKLRMDATAELYDQWGVVIEDLAVKGQTLIAKIFYAVIFGLWTTYHLATSYDIDPVPVEGVEDFKKRLK